MTIRNKTVYVYDIEVFINVFHCTVKNTETNELLKFEISERKNQLTELVNLFWTIKDNQNNTDKIFCGYNNIHYDNPIINYIITYYNILLNKNYYKICNSIFNLSKTIIGSEENIDAWKKYKYQTYFETLDLLTMLYSSKLRVSLKEMQVTMEYPNVLEFCEDWDKPLDSNKIDEMIYYNINDVESTVELLNRCKKDIELRISIEDEYNVNVLSKDGVNIGMKIITEKYLEKTNLSWNDIKDFRNPIDKIPLKDVILPFIKYDNIILQNILEEMKKEVVSPGRKGDTILPFIKYERKFLLNNTEYSVGVGGIHTVNKPEIIIPNDDEILEDADVASLYPSLLIQYKFYPKLLGKEFLEVYSNIKNERIEAKRNGNKLKNETLKLAINGLSGNLQNKYSFCYDPFAVMQIRINGQLLLLMLIDKLVNIGVRIIQANTDGIMIIYNKQLINQVNIIKKNWENITKLELETDKFESLYQYAINDYIAVLDGYKETKNPELIKKKGIFITDIKLGKGLTPKIIPISIIEYFVNKIPIKETILSCKDIKKFLISEKTGKQWNVEYNDKPQQRINRYYASNNGYYLYKWKFDNGNKWFQNMLTSSGVTLLNKFDDVPISNRNINYRYYISETQKIINQLKEKQLSLFN